MTLKRTSRNHQKEWLRKNRNLKILDLGCSSKNYWPEANHYADLDDFSEEFNKLNLKYTQIKKDHKNAKLLAEGLSSIDNISIEAGRVKTNIIYFKLSSDKMQSEEFLKIMGDSGVLFFESLSNQYRLVTHYGITETDIYDAVEIFKKHLSF